ncbi:hypothetical protein F4212_13790 [Candidatus Poribacteria bacterium]|nr:hypothetical protein [Candidatus Poribacteria bacterium]
MNQDLLELIKDYAINEHTDVNAGLLGKSKDNLISMLIDLLTKYFNDVNSSSMRELVVAMVAGYTPRFEKLGYNGYRHNTLTGKVEQCEIKPPNFRTDSTAKQPKKLNGGGNFTDYTWEKFNRHKDENPKMLIGGFVDGRLIYILGFDFNEEDFLSKLEDQLWKRFPTGSDVIGQYLRSAQFSYIHYKNSVSLEIVYSRKRDELFRAKPFIVKDLFTYLLSVAR